MGFSIKWWDIQLCDVICEDNIELNPILILDKLRKKSYSMIKHT